MQVFYTPEIENDNSIILDKIESKHVIKVLRKNVGDTILTTAGDGFIYNTEIVDGNVNKTVLSVIDKVKGEDRRSYKIHLAVAPVKNLSRYEWFIEKATEIGIDTITPVICNHSERRVIKNERLIKTAIAALKQSGKSLLPIVNEAVKFSDFVKQSKEQQKFIAFCEEKTDLLQHKLTANNDVVILIGPEGDFSQSEVDLAKGNGFLPVSLGKSILRAETAAIVACNTVHFVNNNKL